MYIITQLNNIRKFTVLSYISRRALLSVDLTYVCQCN